MKATGASRLYFMHKKPFTPNFNTLQTEFCKEEINKLNHQGLIASNLYQDFRDPDTADMAWESEMIAKSAGIHLQFDRSLKRADKDWYFMIRLVNPGGGPINRKLWQVIDSLSEEFCENPNGAPSVRVTTRQTFQFHWIRKNNVIRLVQSLAQSGVSTLNACGDNVPNVIACPLARFSPFFDSSQMAQRINHYFQLPLDPFLKIFAINPNQIPRPKNSFKYETNLLNRKFKMAIGCAHAENDEVIMDNCVEVRTHDIGIVPIIKDFQLNSFQIYVGGGQAERNGKPSASMFNQALTNVPENKLLKTLDAIVQVHQKWGDRENRHWSRIKYLIHGKGINWFRGMTSEYLGYTLPPPIEKIDCGDRNLHHGWWQQPCKSFYSYGVYIENGRISDDSPNGRLKSMIRTLMNDFNLELSTTPNQDIVFSNIPSADKSRFEATLKRFGYGQRHNKPYSILRKLSGACVGLNTCRIAYTDAENLEPELIDELERRGWGSSRESIGISGCEAQCFRPATKTIGIIGFGWNRYQIKLYGDEAARHQGLPLISEDGKTMYLQSVEREKLADLIDTLFNWHKENKTQTSEDLGAFLRRMGSDSIISHLQSHPKTAELMRKSYTTECELN